jgi:hypothetical protein
MSYRDKASTTDLHTVLVTLIRAHLVSYKVFTAVLHSCTYKVLTMICAVAWLPSVMHIEFELKL